MDCLYEIVSVIIVKLNPSEVSGFNGLFTNTEYR